MTDDDLTSEAWASYATSRDTGEHAFPELGGSGPHVYAYDVRGVRHYDPPRPRKHKPIRRASSHHAFVPRPVTVGETPEHEAQRMRRDPMSAVRRNIVPFHKLRGD